MIWEEPLYPHAKPPAVQCPQIKFLGIPLWRDHDWKIVSQSQFNEYDPYDPVVNDPVEYDPYDSVEYDPVEHRLIRSSRT